MLFLPDLMVYDFVKTVFPKTLRTVKIMEESKEDLKVILVVFVKGLGAVDKLFILFSCEKLIIETDKNKIKSKFFIICCVFKTLTLFRLFPFLKYLLLLVMLVQHSDILENHQIEYKN